MQQLLGRANVIPVGGHWVLACYSWWSVVPTVDSHLKHVLHQWTLQLKRPARKVKPADGCLAQLGRSLKECLNRTLKPVTYMRWYFLQSPLRTMASPLWGVSRRLGGDWGGLLQRGVTSVLIVVDSQSLFSFGVHFCNVAMNFFES
jgi:hypothetical protein